MKSITENIVVILLTVLLAACAGKKEGPLDHIFPDYSDVVIPCNIAPLNFRIDGASRIVVKVNGNSAEYLFKSRGELMKFNQRQWHSMLDAEKGNTLSVSVVSKGRQAGRAGVKMFSWTVSPDSIDRYLSYRLIEPAYEVWSRMQIEERDMESFRTRLIGDNRNAGKACMNCHTTNRNGTSFMHLRGSGGGTMVNRNGNIVKLNTRTENSGGGVYGDISRDGRYIVFTTADITFSIHSRVDKRMEVFDSRSDLMILDIDNLTVSDGPSIKGDEYQETFPCFSSDGKTIFFCRAVHHEQPDSTVHMHYDIAAVQFDPETGKPGDKVYTVVPNRGRLSFSNLKCSPDGKWLMATVADYGTFPVWHDESENWLIDLRTGDINTMEEANARGADTYHSWSSNSRWVIFASKRDDKVYGRPYIAHVDENGKVSRAFLLPVRDPASYSRTLKSYNLPELYKDPEIWGTHETAAFYNKVTPVQVTYK
ncbi:MAG: PD40 domain-containing protein [Bacteroidaceae bacterium]|nr:PD40 domain-containing protein [Bacteroidaceae bacterium]